MNTPDAVETFGAVKLADLAEPALRGRFRWCPELGWLAHNGAKWATDAEPEVLRAVVEVIRSYTASIVEQRPLTRDDCRELAGFSAGSTQTHAIKILRGAAGIRTHYTEFDALPAVAIGQPWTIPCANGITVELYPDGTKDVRRTTADDLNTRTACAYDPDATAPNIAAAPNPPHPPHPPRSRSSPTSPSPAASSPRSLAPGYRKEINMPDAIVVPQSQPLFVVASMHDGTVPVGMVVAWKYQGDAHGHGPLDMVPEPEIVGLSGRDWLGHGFQTWRDQEDCQFFATPEAAGEYARKLKRDRDITPSLITPSMQRAGVVR